MPATFTHVRKLWPTKIRHQLIFGVALVHLLLMTVFVVDLVQRQRAFLSKQSLDQTENLAKILAVNSNSWVLSYDVVGLQEILGSMRHYPGLRYAMVLTPDGRVLGHTDPARVGLYLSDETSRSLLQGRPTVRILHADPSLLDIAVPIQTSTGKVIGWARIGQGQQQIQEGLKTAFHNGLLYTLMAIGIGSVLAFLIGHSLTSELEKLLFVSNQVKNNRLDLRMEPSRTDEISRLGEGLNQMLNAISSGEQRLLKSSEEIQDLYDHAPCGYHSLDKDSVFVRINDTELSWLGYTREEVIGKVKFHELLTPQSLERFRQQFPGFKERGWVNDLDFEMVRKNGTLLPVLMSATAIKTAEGDYVMSRSVVHDITERKQAEEKAAALAAIVESSDDAIIGKTLEGVITSWNKGAEKIYGYTEEETVGRTISFLVPPGLEDEVPGILERLKNGEHIKHYETRRKRKDGQIIDLALSVSPIRNAEGQVIAASTIARDITERKRAEEEIRALNVGLEERVRQRTQELAESEERMRLFFERQLVGMAITSPQKGWLQVNDKLCQMLGYSREELTRLTWSEMTYPEDLAPDVAQFERLLKGEIEDYIIEKRFLRKDGGIVFTNLAVGCVRQDDRSVDYVLALLEDITERKRAEEAIRILNATLEERVLKRTAQLKEANDTLNSEITERKQAEEALRHSTEQFKKLVEQSPLSIQILDPGGRTLQINKAFEDLWSLSMEDLADYNMLEDQELERKGLMPYIKRGFSGEAALIPAAEYDAKGVMPEGQKRWVHASIYPVKDEQGAIRNLVIIHEDITERKQAEDELRRLNRELRAISNCNQTLMRAEDEQTLLNAICHIVCDEAGYRMAWVGYAEHDDNKPIRPVVWAGVEDGYLAAAKLTWADTERGHGPTGTAIRTGETTCIQDFATDTQAALWRESALQRGYGSSIALALKDESANTFGALTIYSTEPNAFTHDEMRLLEELAGDLAFGITTLRGRIERKRAEEHLRKEAERSNVLLELYEKAPQLTENELYDFALSHAVQLTSSEIGFLHLISDDQKTIILTAWNREALKSCTVVTETHYAIEKAGNWADCVRLRKPVVYNDFPRSPNQKGIPQGHTPVRRFMSVPVVDGDKVRIIFGVGNKAQDYDDPDIIHMQLVANELQKIIQQRRADDALKKAKEAAEFANHAKDQFIAVLSHELRTPLTPVLATVSALQAQEDVTAELRADMDLIRRNVEMEAKLVDDLLDVTKISRGTMELHHEVVDVHLLLRTALEICQQDIEAKHMDVSLSLQADPHQVRADPTRLRQVFWNLLKNAVEFTPEKGRISLRTTNVNGRLKIEIEDTGVGIRPELLPKIFNAFERGDQTTFRRFGGLGLGLSIAKTVVEMHQGTITAFSEGEGKGATFTVELPSIAPASEQPSLPPPSLPNEERPRKILLVDDHPDTLRTMSKLLCKWGYVVVTADCVRAALEAAAKESFDLLLSDLGLPDGSGMDIMREVKRLYALRGIALSGYGTEEDIRRSLDAGFEIHLTKPVSFQDLRNAVRTIVLKAT